MSLVPLSALKHTGRPRVLVLAEDCNPEWPSLPVVGYKYAMALAAQADIVVATHVRNRTNILARDTGSARFVFLDNEYIAAPLYRLSSTLRGGAQVAWSTNMMMKYLPYLAFEREVWRQFASELKAGRFDLVHRITPMSPTLPSLIAGRVSCPFVLGPLNGNLDWPRQFRTEQRREREMLRKLRGLYRALPYSAATYRHADLILTAFPHTADGVPAAARGKVVDMPEIGFDANVFTGKRKRPAFAGAGPYRFMFAGRLVPYKLPEVAIRAFADTPELREHRLHIVGDGPELQRLRDIVARENLADVVIFEGRKSQSELAGMMAGMDGLIFPSIRELGAGVVIEAMACGMTCIVVDYGAPGHLAAGGRGHRLPLSDLNGLVASCREAVLQCIKAPENATEMAEAGRAYAWRHFTWDAKAQATLALYRDLLAGRPSRDVGPYGSD